ncbi:MAG: lysine--tRNA ligase [Acidimicrobiia bacterium]
MTDVTDEPESAPDEPQSPAEERRSADEERTRRLGRLAELQAAGTEPYPVRFDRTATLAELRDRYAHLPAGSETEDRVAVAGRVMLLRRQGKLTFGTLRDRSGEIQLFVSRAVIGDGVHDEFDQLDLGDWIGVEGVVMTTRRGELSVKVDGFQLLAKCLRPLPDKWKGLQDTDRRYRQREVDLVMNADARRIFEVRHKTVATLRRELDDRGFVEVEGPVLQLEAGGATARPFVTHHNALDVDMFLRIALELHLKRLIVGGMERVFEIGRVFRNEGIDTRHNPEFTMLELYQAYGDYTEMMEILESLTVACARAVNGSTFVNIDGEEVDLAPPWPRVRMVDLVSEKVGETVHPSDPPEKLRKMCDRFDVKYEDWWGSGRLIGEFYDGVIERTLLQPTFVLDHPTEISPLARAHRDDPHLTERFEAVVGRRELGNAFSELNDPVVQRERFEAELDARAHGDDEAGTVDEDFLRALEYGMPPTGGLGFGVDRLVMLLAGTSTIREVILFPTLRPEASS